VRLSEIENIPWFYKDPLYIQYKQQINFALDKYMNQKSAIYKGGSYVENKLYFRDPMSFEQPRQSQNTKNYYTLWMDASEKWSHFPKRSRGLICSSSQDYAYDFGSGLGIVVPTVDCAIGVCSGQDLWYSFEKTAETTLNTFNAFLRHALELAKQNQAPTNIEQLTQALSKVKIADPEFEELDAYGSMRDQAIKFGGLNQLMDYVFNPAKNGFKLTTWKKYNIKSNNSREVWLNAPCVIVPYDLWQTLVSLKHREEAGK
jgi:hypothetical protein